MEILKMDKKPLEKLFECVNSKIKQVKYIPSKVSNTVEIIGFASLLCFFCSFAELTAQNKVITDFPSQHFKFVKGPGSDSIEHIGGNRYRMFDSDVRHSINTVGMWYIGNGSPNAGKIDFSADLSFVFRIAFGNGESPEEPIIGDGATLTFTTEPVADTLLGEMQSGLGYKDIANSFAIEFDTKWQGASREGGSIPGHPSGANHTAFISNGSMDPLNGLHPLQNNFATVRAKEICVLVEWKRNLQTGGYDLKLFTTEGNNNPKGLILRNSMSFASLNAFISTLSEQMPYASVGFTAANCSHPNSVEVELIHLENGIYAMKGCPPIVITLMENYLLGAPPQDGQGEPFPPPPIFENLYTGYSCCDNDVFGKTIIRNGCLHSRVGLLIEISGINMSQAQWWIGDSLVQTGTEPAHYDSSKYAFPISDYSDLYEGKDSITLRAIINGDTLVFKFNLNENERVAKALAEHFKTTGDSISVKGNVGSMLVTNEDRTQAISLLRVDGCKYFDLGDFDSTKFEAPLPQIVNDTLHFTLKEGECYAELPIFYDCLGCPAEFIFKVYGFNAAVAKNASCKGAEIRYSSCNSDEVNDLVMFKIYDSNGVLVDSAIGSKSSVFTKKSGNYSYKFYNIITGKELDSGNIEINETDLSLPFTFSITSVDKEFVENWWDNSISCHFTIQMTVSDRTKLPGYSIVATQNGISVPVNPIMNVLYLDNRSVFEAKFVVDCDEYNDNDFDFVVNVMHHEKDLYTSDFVEISVCSDTLFLSCSCKDKCDFNLSDLGVFEFLKDADDVSKKCDFQINLSTTYTVLKMEPPTENFEPKPYGFDFTMDSPCYNPSGFTIGPPPGGGLPYSTYRKKTYKITFLDDKGDTCNISATFSCACTMWSFKFFVTVPIVRVEYEMADILIPFLPLNIFLTDNTGNKLRHLHTITLPEQLNGQFYIDMLELPSGIYHIVIETGNNEILGSEQFIFTK